MRALWFVQEVRLAPLLLAIGCIGSFIAMCVLALLVYRTEAAVMVFVTFAFLVALYADLDDLGWWRDGEIAELRREREGRHHRW